jgi:hypothetical protein
MSAYQPKNPRVSPANATDATAGQPANKTSVIWTSHEYEGREIVVPANTPYRL